MDAAYEGRKDINDMKRQLRLEVREIPPPLVFPPYEETLGERMSILRRERGQSMPQRHTTTTHRADMAIVSDSDEESGERTVLGNRQQTNPTDDDDSDIGSD